MRPPQASPTAKASSSETPNSSIWGVPVPTASIASTTTAPSTQPPETEPAISPSPEIASWLPTGRGAEPQVSTTVASTAPLPARCQASACSGMFSRSVV
jgi:cytoskeletal protein RodZ